MVNPELAGRLQSFKRLAVMELDYDTHLTSPHEIDEVGREICKGKREAYLKELKKQLIPILKDSSSDNRKFLKWKFSENHLYRGPPNRMTDLVERGELEVLPGTSLIA